MLVDDRIDFNDFKAGHASVVGDDLHSQVGFTITGATTDRRSHTRSVFWIDPIHVQRDVITGGAASHHAQRLFDDSPHAALVDVAHGVNLDADLVDVFFFAGINITNADHN